jgi:hypothetical protein
MGELLQRYLDRGEATCDRVLSIEPFVVRL